MSQVDLLEEVHHLRFTVADRSLRNAWEAYRVSPRTRQLASEANRATYAEALWLAETESCSRTFFPASLATLAVECLVGAYSGGPVPDGLSCEQKEYFGHLLDVELPVLQLLQGENETFWKRVVKAKTKTLVHFLKLEKEEDIYWRPRGIELKVAEAIERERPEYWFEGDLEDIIISSAPIVKNLVISQLLPLQKVEPAEGYEEYKLYDVPAELCSHGSLKILRHLENLTSLSLIFGLDEILKGYERRFFQFSLEDVENFVEALDKMIQLKHFKMARSHLTTDKLKILLNHLAQLKLESLEFSYCYLGEGSGILLGKFISKCPSTLKVVNLAGNFLNAKEIEDFGYGINVFQGVLQRLDISHNLIGEAGVLMLGGAVKNTEQLRELNVTACELGEEGAFRVVQLLGFHRPLRVLQMNCTPLGRAGGKKLIDVLKANWHVEVVDCKFCQLKESHVRRIQSILRRNGKFARVL
ncbi:uncharacterized protein LOC6031085 [Culex quinquefasciatus]|uniref:uncharacterized protein LOC6031085 n=1 Tax=Culex quinquefasciatus TaxID=7176 RepID=UPI0018E34155|nr:uncharacterized protein LOC6031085 [Culex quinquefasciatus]